MTDSSSSPGGPPSPVVAPDTNATRPQARRISYFMLFRLGMLAAFTVLAAALTYEAEQLPGYYAWFIWGSLGVGYALTLAYAWVLPRVGDLDAFARLQTATDITLSAVVVQMSGGVDSGFAFLYLLAVLGAAIMGNRAQILAAAGVCLLIYGIMSTLELTGIAVPMGPRGQAPQLDPRELWATVARTVAALGGVTALSSFLNTQLASSTLQIGSLRALNENIVRSLNSGLITTDERGEVMYLNPTAGQLLKVDELEVGRPLEQLMPGISAAIDTRDALGSRHDLEFTLGDGTRRHLGLSLAALMDGSGQRVGTIVNFQDVTQLHDLALEVRRNERLAAIGGLAASVAHEIRNPLAAISGSAELLAGSDLSSDDARLLDVVVRESARLNELVTDLLAFTRPKQPSPVDLDLETVATEVRDSFAADPTNAKITVEISAEEGAHMVHADPSQLSQVLWNLLRNAAEAMNGGGSIEIGVFRRGQRIAVSVRDDGPGMPLEVLERAFDPFFTTKETGTGFGLAVAHRVMEEHQGELRAESRPGQGATLTVLLPAADA